MAHLLHIISALFINLAIFARVVLWLVPRLIWRILLQPRQDYSNKEKTTSRPYLMMLSFIEWDGSWQRPQHLASHLSRQMDVVCCAPVRAHNLPIRRAIQLLFSFREEVTANLTVLRPLLLPAENKLRFVRQLNALILFDLLQREIGFRSGIPDILLTNSPFFALPFTWLPARLRAYDVMDELIRFPWAPPDARELERLVVAQCDLVTTGTKSLSRLKTEQYSDLGCDAHYVPLGVDAQHFAAPPPEMPIPEDIAALPRPIIGFFGAINERVDPEVIDALAEGFPEGSIVLIGPVYQRFNSLENRKNVHFLGLKPYKELPRYLAAFDCAIIPYRLTDGIEFVQPVKVLEYLAGGKPVISTAIPDVAELYANYVRIARDSQDFVRLTREAIAEGNQREKEYVAVSMARNWEEMASDFARLFKSVSKEKQAAPRQVTHLLHGVHFGGAEQLVIEFCRQYDPTRFRGSVVCLGNGQIMQERLREADVPAQIVKMRNKWDLCVVFPLIRRFRMNKTSIIHTHTSRTNLMGRLVSRIVGIPVVTTIHTAVARDINDMGRSNRINAWIERLTQNWSARLVSVSERNHRELLDNRADPAKTLHIPNGVIIPSIDDLCSLQQAVLRLRQEFGIANEGPVIGMLAMMRPRKGPDVLLRAMPEVLKRIPDATLLMVGSGEFVEKVNYLDALKQLSAELGISEKVLFTGYRADTTKMISIMDVFVLPSLFGEGMPLVLLEAMALEKPVIATRTEGNDEVIRDGENGLLVPPNDPSALAEAIVHILNNRDLAHKMGKSGRSLAETLYSVEKMTRRYEDEYGKILGVHF